MPTIKAMPKWTYGLEDVVWRISRWLFSAWQFLISEWDDFSYSESQFCLKHPIKFLLDTIYGLEDAVWRISRCLSISGIWMEWFYLFWVSMLHPNKFLLKGIYGLEDVFALRIPNCLFMHDHLWYLNGMIWAIQALHFVLMPPIKFLLKRMYGLEKDIIWSTKDSCHGGTTQRFCRLWVFKSQSNALQT